MAIGSGISAQVVIGQESTWATAVTPDHSYEFTSESVNFVKNPLQGLGLHAGGQYKRSGRRVISTKAAAGQVTLDHATKKMNLLWKHMLGSTPVFTQQASTTAYTGLHQPGALTGYGLTYQKGVPQTDGTVRPFTFNGGKISSWTFSVADGQIAQLAITMDFQNVATATALVAAAYPTGNEVFSFSQATNFKLGGTPSTSSGVVSIASGVSVATVVNAFSLTGSNPMKADRYGLGNAGLKKEQIENDYRTLTGNLGGEFTSRTELWDLFQADTGTAMQLTLVGSNIASTYYNTLDIVIPVVKFNTGDVSVGGPDVVGQSLDFEVLDDGVNAPIQVTITSTDTAV